MFENAITEAQFITRYWQKEPLLLRNAFPAVQGLVDPDELAGLACEDDVYSRLVTCETSSSEWTCEHGPFVGERFATLPASGWTLLVSTVDEQFPEVHELLSRFAFLPRWRVDDIMASYATNGGGVGPHFDYYDVFLIQAEGTRQWRLGQRCDARSPLRAHPDLRLLERFDAGAEHELEPGDMLYVPPGLAHWGTATSDDCITLSVGFRAPSHGEVVHGTAGYLAQALDEDRRYRDTPQSIDADPYRINAAALAETHALWNRLDDARIASAVTRFLGHHATVPRNPDRVVADRPRDTRAIDRCLVSDGALGLRHHPSSRFAYAIEDGRGLLFVDGDLHVTSPDVARGICHGALVADVLGDDQDRSLVLELLNRGSLDLR